MHTIRPMSAGERWTVLFETVPDKAGRLLIVILAILLVVIIAIILIVIIAIILIVIVAILLIVIIATLILGASFRQSGRSLETDNMIRTTMHDALYDSWCMVYDNM